MGGNQAVRILHLVNDMGRGGVETWLMHVFRSIDRKRFMMDFMVYTDRSWQYDDEIRELGGRLLSASHPRRLRRFSGELREIIRRHGPYRAVHSHSPMTDGVSMGVAVREGVPVRIVHCHNDVSKILPENKIKRLYFRWSMLQGRRLATHGLATSGLAARSYFGTRWREDPRWRVHLCAMDFSPFGTQADRNTLRRELGIAEDAFVIGHVGKLIEQKNHAFLLQVAAELARDVPDIRVLIVGDGPLENAIKQQIAALGLEKHVLLTGSRPDVPALMGGVMDLFVLPSFYEGLGLVLVEAQAAGLPCLCADVIPSEAEVVSPLVTRMSLGRPISEWANAIRSYRGKRPPVDRQRAFEIVQASRFNLHRGNLEELEKIYSRGDNGSSR